LAEWFKGFFGGLYKRVLARQFPRGRTCADARYIKRLLRVRRGQRVLDIPCGMGRLTIPLARMGLRMTGVDLSSSYIRTAKQAAKRARVRMEFVCNDMRGIDYQNSFDAAFNWFGSFGYFSDGDNLDFTRRVFRALKPGGRFLVEGPNRRWILANFQPRMESDYCGVRIVQRNHWDGRTGRAVTSWTFRYGRKVERHTSRMWIFDGAGIKSFMRSAGFKDVRLYSRVPGEGYGPRSRRIIAVGRRPG
jgi:SAM-dependent methyltransferase